MDRWSPGCHAVCGDERTPKRPDLHSVVTSLWFRLICLGIAALVFTEALLLAPGKAQGWTFYLTGGEVIFEVVVRLIAAALAGVVAGTLLTAIISPVLWYFESSRESVAAGLIKVVTVIVVFLDSRLALKTLINQYSGWHGTLLLRLHILVFVVILCIPRRRRELTTVLDGMLTETETRRTAIATGVSTAALVATEFALSKTVPAVAAAASVVRERPKSNILLVTFDALCAEDLSLYGRPLPTTPNIDAFARNASVFDHFYSASTFTTPCVTTMLTGLHPSESHVHQLQGRVNASRVEKSLPHLMQAAGYTTAAFASNPFAYYLVNSLGAEYDVLPEPVFQEGGLKYLWSVTAPLHQNSGVGTRIDEYFDMENLWNSVAGIPSNLSMRMRPDQTFQHGREILEKLPEGFFLWVHVITPHKPYLPDPSDRGRFVVDDKRHNFDDESDLQWFPHYAPNQQSQVDLRRLRYDEFLATADRAFGHFMSELEGSGRQKNTTVIFSADHGESFEGGVFQHSSPYLTRPVVHIPLIVRTPGQQGASRIAFTADQTALAPTILELAGQSKPDWMPGQSVANWLGKDGGGDGQGLAFTEYLEKNSAFRSLHHGTVGVFDGQFEYVLNLDTQKGSLRPISESHIWNLDRSAEYPEVCARLRAAIYARFHNLPGSAT